MEKKLLMKEELEANAFLTKSLQVWMLLYIVVGIMNELGLFYVPKIPMRVAVIGAVMVCLVCMFITRWENEHKTGKAKYLLIGAVLVMAFISFAMLSFHVVIITLVPIVIASYYNDSKLLPAVIIITIIMAPLAIILSIKLGTFSAGFLEFLVLQVNPDIIDKETYSALFSGPIWISDPTLMILFFYVIPLALETAAFGYLAWCVYRGRNASHQRQIEAVKTMQNDFTLSMSDIIESRDKTTGGHTKRTKDIMRIFVSEIRKHDKQHDERYWETIVNTAPLHDIGKISIDDCILRKPGRLTDEEYQKIKNHSFKSGELIERVFENTEDREFVDIVRNIGMYHHERWDGTGYPEGLKGEAIPYEARIMAYADVTDALLTKRPYKDKFSYDETLDIIKQSSGTQFDPNLMHDFEMVYPEIIAYYSNQ